MIESTEATVSYFGDNETLLPAALNSIDLIVPAGQSTLTVGDSGCGETILLRCLNGSVSHFFGAHVTGSITPGGVPMAQLPPHDLASRVGTTFQDPRSELFTLDATSELAFYYENFAMLSGRIIRRVDEIAPGVGITDLLSRRTVRFSGGEKQRLAIESVMALSPRVLLFDEPPTNLDLDGLDILHGVTLDFKERGMTTVIADRHLSYLDGVTDHCIVLETGRVAADITSDRLGQLSDAWFANHGFRRLRRTEFRSASSGPFDQAGPKIRDTQFAHPRCTPLRCIDRLTLPTSGVISITGANDTDKTTPTKILLGLLESREKIDWGERTWARRQHTRGCALVMQDVEYQLVGESVWDKMLIGFSPGPATEARTVELLTRISLEELCERYPPTLSGGQKQRLGIASACMKQARVICFDEPTSGLNAGNTQWISGLLRSVTGDDTLVLVITYDAEFIKSIFDHTVHIDDRQVVLEKLAKKEE